MSNLAVLAGIMDPIANDGFLNAFYWWQVPLIILLIAIIVGWVMYRRKQM